MENNLITEFGNYLLSINNTKEGKELINEILFKASYVNKLLFVRLLRIENETENKSEIVKDKDGLESIIHRYSQLIEFINIFGLIDNEENKLKLNQYLNELLLLKSSL